MLYGETSLGHSKAKEVKPHWLLGGKDEILPDASF